MGQAAEVWNQLSAMFEAAELGGVLELYTADSLYLEPYNPPHRGNLLIQAYLKDFFGGKEGVKVVTTRLIESADGDKVAVEWTLSYDAAGRRWNELPRATFLELDDRGQVVYHRDYA